MVWSTVRLHLLLIQKLSLEAPVIFLHFLKGHRSDAIDVHTGVQHPFPGCQMAVLFHSVVRIHMAGRTVPLSLCTFPPM